MTLPPMRGFFSDRFRLLKFLAAAALFVALCHHARRTLGPANPSFSSASVYGETLRGQSVSTQARRVLAHAPDGFDLETEVGPMRIVTAERPPVGKHVTIAGRVAGNRRVEASAVQVNEGWTWKRPLNYAVSVLTVIVFLWAARNRFRTRLSEGLFRSRF